MKQSRFLLLVAATLLVTGLSFAAQRVMSVQIRDAKVRETPSPLGKINGTLAHCERVTVLEEKGSFLKVSSSNGVTGWIDRRSLTPKKLTMSAGAEVVVNEVSSGEQANAAKGFSQQAEAAFKDAHGDVSFEWVDKMEKIRIDENESRKFLDDGQVNGPAVNGGAQ